MQNKNLFVLIFMACLFSFSACEKYEATISGNVVFMEDGVAYTAEDAIITKIQLKGTKETIVAREKTDVHGDYTLNHTAKGSWKIGGRLEMEDLVYEGFSDVIEVDGTNKKVNLVLLRINNE